MSGVFAFAVFTHDHPVEFAGFAVTERRGGAFEDFGGTHVGVLLEGLADC